jgi:chemotaxis receptor (MCP) glutamine deamidase CheD
MDVEYTTNYLIGNERIYQGEITEFNNNTKSTILGSCVSVILFSEELKKGCISHILGVKLEDKQFGLGKQVIEEYQNIEKKNSLKDAIYYIIGGSKNVPSAYDQTIYELEKKKIKYEIIDVLGKFTRKIMLIPKESKLLIKYNIIIILH